MLIAHDKLFIGGRWVKPAGSAAIDVISPITEELIGRVPDATPADIDQAVAAARRAFDEGPWPKMSIAERAGYLLRMMEILDSQQEEIVNLQIREMGGPRKFFQPVTASQGRQLQAAIRHAEALPTREVRDGSNGKIVVLREPIGVIAAIIPWNGPIVMLLQELAPALLTGCPIVIKPAPESPLSAYLVAEALIKAGIPEGVVSIVAGGREAGEYLVAHPGINKVVFTGSVESGGRVASVCGSQIKPVTLELGGKSAAIVLDDVDLDKELPSLIGASMPNNGQACVATTRILLPASRYDEIRDRIVSAVARMKVGNPLDNDTDVGPVVARRQRDRIEGYIKLGIQEGAKLAFGGGRPPIEKGWYVEPTVFSEVDNSTMRIAREEIFGPVVSLIRYGSQDDAIRIANDSPYGLGGAVFSSDIERALTVAAQIRTGFCAINCSKAESGTLRGFKQAGGGGPFGGYKQSGIGRRNGLEGIASYYQLKSVVLPPGFNPRSS